MAVIKSSVNGTTWTTATVTGTGSTTWATSTVHSLAYAGGVWVAGNNASQVAISTSTNTFNIPQIPDPANTGVSWTTRNLNLGTSSNMRIFKVGFGNGIFMAVGGYGQLRNSTDGITWVTGNSIPGGTGLNIRALGYGNGRWICSNPSSSYGMAISTNNGSSWSTVLANATFYPLSIGYGNGVWVAFGSQVSPASAVRSTDNGLTWTTVTSNFGTTVTNTVIYENNLWVAGGGSGQMRTSTDGSTWTTQNSNFGIHFINSIAYGNGLWAAVGTGGNIRTSTNGSTWTTVTSPTTNTITEIAYANGLWVAFAAGGFAVRSTNGSTWTTQNISFTTTIVSNGAITFGANLWFITGSNRESVTSPQAFSQVSLPNTQISSFNTSFMAVSSNRARSSTDGITWTTLSGFEAVHVNKFVESNGKHMLLGNSGVLYEKNTSTTTWTTRSTGIADNFVNGAIQIDYTRPDTTNTAVNWTTVTSNFGAIIIWAIAYGNSLWVAGGASGQIRTSTNGSTWTTQTSATAIIRSIAYGNGLWIAGGANGEIRTSTDGSTWTTQTSNFGATTINSVAYGNSLWVAGGASGQMRTSTNGSTWTTQTSNFDTTSINSVAYGNSLWVAGGASGQIRTSTDGSTWTTQTSNFDTTSINSVAYGNGLWVAGGASGQIRTSTDGSTWTTQTSNFGATTIQSIAYANGLWVAGGWLAQIRTSTNGSTWTTQTSNFGSSDIYAIAYANGLWIAGGRSTSGEAPMRTSSQLYNYNYNITGNNASYYSTNLTTWTTVAFPAASTINDIIAK